MKKVYVVGYSKGYARFIKDYVLVDDITQADIVLLTGGEDINPALYEEEVHDTTWFNAERDEYELDILSDFNPNKQLLWGTCRGFQFICALAGGKLFQNVHNHAGRSHNVQFSTGEVLTTTSLHHQMINVDNLSPDKYEILGWSQDVLSPVHEGSGVEFKKGDMEIEVAYFPEINAMGCQGHPEMQNIDHPFVVKMNELIDARLKEMKK